MRSSDCDDMPTGAPEWIAGGACKPGATMTPEMLKDIGLIVGSVGTIVAAVAKVLDESQQSKTSAAAPASQTETEEKPQIPRSKRSLYVSIVALAVAVLGFVLSFAFEMKSQRLAVESAKTQADVTQRMLEGLTKTLTRIDSISIDLSLIASLNAIDAKDLRSTLAGYAADFIDECDKPINKRIRPMVLGSCTNREYFRYQFSYAGDPQCIAEPGSRFTCQILPRLFLYRHAVSIENIVSKRIFSNAPAPDLTLPLPPFSASMQFTVASQDPFDAESINKVRIELAGVSIPRNKWSPTGQIRSLSELSEAQLVVEVPSGVDITAITLAVNGESIKVDVSRFTKFEESLGVAYSYIFPK